LLQADIMVALAGQRAQFTWALNEYNKTDDEAAREKYVRHMAAAIRNSVAAGFKKEQITRDKNYPADKVEQVMATLDLTLEPDVSEAQVKEELRSSVDAKSAKRRGIGNSSVYAYGYRCAPDRLKIGYTDGDVIERIADQIGTSTPDKPILFLEIRTNDSRTLERALHSILIYRKKKIFGGGDEWFRTSVDEIERLYDLIGKEAFAASDATVSENLSEPLNPPDSLLVNLATESPPLQA
jgi:T5orf172 domain